MPEAELLDVTRQALMTVVIVASPLLLLGVAVGLLSGLFQTLTQIHDQSLSFAPKLLVVLVALGVGLPWMMEQLSQFAATMFATGG